MENSLLIKEYFLATKIQSLEDNLRLRDHFLGGYDSDNWSFFLSTIRMPKNETTASEVVDFIEKLEKLENSPKEEIKSIRNFLIELAMDKGVKHTPFMQYEMKKENELLSSLKEDYKKFFKKECSYERVCELQSIFSDIL